MKFTLRERIRFFFHRRFYSSGHTWDAYHDSPDWSCIESWAGIRFFRFKLGLEWYTPTTKETCTCEECKQDRINEAKYIAEYRASREED